MKGFRASFYKDRKMFRGISGVLMIVLPLILCVAMFFGMSRSSSASFIQPFSIAVRDEDQTIMSRSLISQMREVEMFSSVDKVNDESDQKLLDRGYAGVVTIPKDFFYSVYDAEDNPVTLTLNEKQPVNAAILKTVFTSVMDIISSNQSSQRGLYEYLYGNLNNGNRQKLYAESSEHIVDDALGRQKVFDADIEPADLLKPLLCRLAATLLFMMAAGESIAALKTVSEEKRNGVFVRFIAAGGNVSGYVLSKFTVVLLTMIPSCIAAGVLLQIQITEIPVFLLLSVMEILCVFGIICFISVLSHSLQSSCRNGNLYLLAGLVTGGTLWSFSDMHTGFRMIGKGSGSYHLYLSLMALKRGWHLSSVIRMELPYMIVCISLGVISLFLLRTDLHSGLSKKTNMKDPFLLKYRTVHGGSAGILLILAVCLCGGYAVAERTGGNGQSLSVAITDEDHSHLSNELVHILKQQNGIHVYSCNEATGSQLILSGDMEGQLIIPEGYGKRIQNQSNPELHYESSSGSFSTQSVREIIAGQVIRQQAYQRVFRQAQEYQNEELSEEENKELQTKIGEASEELPDVYRINEKKGADKIEELFTPSVEAYGVMACLTMIMMLGSFFASGNSRAVENRMFTVKNGILKSYWLGDLAVLVTAGFLIMIVTQLPSWILNRMIPWHEIPVYLIVSFTFSGITLSLNRLVKDESMMNGFAPFLAVILCLSGGCFLDLNGISEMFHIITCISPAGAALQAVKGNMTCLILLSTEGILFSLTGKPVRK